MDIFFLAKSYFWISMWAQLNESHIRSSFFGKYFDHLNGICQYYIGKKWGFKASINLFCDKFRGGVSELQFNQVLNIELDQIIEVWATSKFFEWVLVLWVLVCNLYDWNCWCRPASFSMRNGAWSFLWSSHRRAITPSTSSQVLHIMFHLVYICTNYINLTHLEMVASKSYMNLPLW